MTRILLAGASGMVGREVLRQALANPRVGEIVAPTRRPLAADAKLRNPVVDFDDLPDDAPWWQADAAICALGTTLREAGSQAAFRKVDLEYPLTVARHTLAHGAATFVLTSASGANADSRIFYSRTKGELEAICVRSVTDHCAWCGLACSAANANDAGRSNTPACNYWER